MDAPPPTRRRAFGSVLAATILIGALALIGGRPAAVASARGERESAERPTIVLVHGSFADSSGFNDVIQQLQQRGYATVAPPNPLRSLTSDASYIRSVLEGIPGPIVLVAHSYGGAVITNAATGNPNVKALVYINGFAPAEGEILNDLVSKFPGSMITQDNITVRPYPATDPTALGLEATINADVFREAFAADLSRKATAVMAASQRPIDLATLTQPSGAPAWAAIPSWFIFGKDDNTIPVELHRFFAERAGAVRTVELRSSHVLMMSHPDAVVRLIVDAARS